MRVVYFRSAGFPQLSRSLFAAPEEGDDLGTGADRSGGERRGAGAGGDALLAGPQDGLVVARVRDGVDITERVAGGGRLRAAGGAPQERHDLGAGAGLVRGEGGAGRAVGDVLADGPLDGVVEVVGGLDVDEVHRLADLDGHGAGELAGAGAGRADRRHAPQEVLDKVQRWASLGREAFEERVGECSWEVALVVPYSAFFLHRITSLDGQTIRANFYKCGDNLETPHFLSWNPIELEKPNFHCPEFFGMLRFK